jgi:hypothetical protein
MATCPHCMIELHDRAVVCRGCGAQKGYSAGEGRAYGKNHTAFWGILVPFGLLVPPLIFWGANIFTEAFAAIMGLAILHTIYRLVKGPVWFR